jgi:hypothetical protein
VKASPTLVAFVAGMAAFASVGAAHAVTVSVGGTTYDVTTFTGSYDDNISRFNTTEMPWLGSASLASDLAAKIGSNLGLPNSGAGPFFTYTTKLWWGVPVIFYISQFPFLNNGAYPSNTNGSYAVLSPQASPVVPGPLPLFAAFAAFRTSRCLRRRIKLGS